MKILIFGSGGLRVGQAGEFDYSGSQAIKALKEENVETILINPNIATTQTDPHLADKVYFYPLNFESALKVIEQEKPDGVLLGFGGQTALNLGLELDKRKVFLQNKVRVLGTTIETIRKTEDRQVFKSVLESVNIKVPKSSACSSLAQVETAIRKIECPLIIRSSYTLGGLGSSVFFDQSLIINKAKQILKHSPQLLIEEYLEGWKEFEFEVIRDIQGNSIVVCAMENLDPMGIHTGESIVISPTQTLTDDEFSFLRDLSIKIAQKFEIVGECNIQYAINPKNGDYRVIELNARLSRSSALASKVTGYPIAYVAAKIALSKPLFEIKNKINQKTTAFFEPALDYVALKIPKWEMDRFSPIYRKINSEMKSVGEVMAIGRSFPEALQKAVSMLNIGANDLSDYPQELEDLESEIKKPTDRRIFAIYQFLLNGGSPKIIHKWSGIDFWFLNHLACIASKENEFRTSTLSRALLLEGKQFGFSDKSLGSFFKKDEKIIRELRYQYGIIPHIKQIDSLAGEIPSKANYLYLTYNSTEDDLNEFPETTAVLGSGPYCIGSSVEFDWCAVNTLRSLRKKGLKTILINCNPETVSTDYDESDYLFFEPITLERVTDILEKTCTNKVILFSGGQVSNNLAIDLGNKYQILGSSARSIDLAESREKFSKLLNEIKINQPRWFQAKNLSDIETFITEVGYPVILRPSYVLSGTGMTVINNLEELNGWLKNNRLIKKFPIVLSEFITNAKEIEIDGVAQNGKLVIGVLSEHIERAGTHSGDATAILPPQSIDTHTQEAIKQASSLIVSSIKINGPFNLQFLVTNREVRVIECNLRCSRSFPLCSKATGENLVEISIDCILNSYDSILPKYPQPKMPFVKNAVFSFDRLHVDPVSSVEMFSTGEVAFSDEDVSKAILMAFYATGIPSFTEKNIFIDISKESLYFLLPQVRYIQSLGWKIFAQQESNNILQQFGIFSSSVNSESTRDFFDLSVSKFLNKIELIVSLKEESNKQKEEFSKRLRLFAIQNSISLVTELNKAKYLLNSL